MKTIANTITAIIVLFFAATNASAKSKTLTVNQYQLAINKIDSSVVGTWEKNWDINSAHQNMFCQFNSNGTFITFHKVNNEYVVTERGKWNTQNGIITILHGNEKTNAVKYKSNSDYLSFENNISYTKPTATIANK